MAHSPGSRRFLDGLKEKRKLLGTWSSLPGAWIARILAKCDYDFICVDCEHGIIDDAARTEMVNAIADCGVSPIVRVARHDDFVGMKRSLDCGAHGIIVPMVETADQVKDIVKACRMPPTGNRGFGFFCGHTTRQSPAEYAATANECALVIIMIESTLGFQNLEEIIKVAGFDGVFIGEGDLSASMGKLRQDPIVTAVSDTVLDHARSRGLYVGNYAMNVDHARKLARVYDFVGLGGDVQALHQHLSSEVAGFRN